MSAGRRPLERRAATLVLAGGLPAVVAALALAVAAELSTKAVLTLALVVVGSWLAAAAAVHGALVRTLRTLANLVASLREGDYSVRGRGARRDHALGEVHAEVNALAAALRDERLREVEASALLARLLDEVEVVVLAFDAAGLLRLANRGAERLLGAPAAELTGRPAAALGLAEVLEGPAPRVVDRTFAGGAGRFELRRTAFRRGGAAHVLVLLSDVSRALRDEERAAWRSLVRVLSHEILNSTAPIQSVASGLLAALERAPPPGAGLEDLRPGLELVSRRAEALSRFISAYARLARLPPPALAPVPVAPLARRAAALEARVVVVVEPGPEVEVLADGDQVEQVLINLLRNAADAVAAAPAPADRGQPAVAVRWRLEGDGVALEVADAGPGLADTKNLFVPFFTTKPGGSGIGLALSRQIAEAHGGRLALANRTDGRGCLATLWLPRAAAGRTRRDAWS